MSRSETLFNNVQKRIPGGVNSLVCAFKSVSGVPLFFKHAGSAYALGEDDKRYVDYIGSWGPMIPGHNHPDVFDAARRQLDHGLSYGASTALEVEVVDLVCSMVSSMEVIRMVSSDTEATISVTRLARSYTGRDNIIKLEGCYHGHSDNLLMEVGSGALTFGIPSSPGVPAVFAKHTLTLLFNNIETVRKTLDEADKEVACIVVEPVASNVNCVPPAPGFLEGLRGACDEHGVMLILDEVMTGLRVVFDGAQTYYEVTPDLSTFGKIIGGDILVDTFGGKCEIMQQISPLGPVCQAGILSGSPLAMAAGLTTLCLISRPDFHDELTAYTTHMLDGLQQRVDATGVPFVTTQAGGIFGLYFSGADTIVAFEGVMVGDVKGFKRFSHLILDDGAYLTPSVFETGFTSITRGDEGLEITLNVAEKAFAVLR